MRLTVLAAPRGWTASQHRDRTRATEGHREKRQAGLSARSAALAHVKPKQIPFSGGRPAPTKRWFGQGRRRSRRTVAALHRIDDPLQQAFPGLPSLIALQRLQALRAKRHTCFLCGPLWSSCCLCVESFLLHDGRTSRTRHVRHASRINVRPVGSMCGRSGLCLG
jgi:hypothetical protein